MDQVWGVEDWVVVAMGEMEAADEGGRSHLCCIYNGFPMSMNNQSRRK